MNKEQFYGLLFGDMAAEMLRKEQYKEFYDKKHHQHNIELRWGKIWYSGNHVFTDFECSTEYRAKQQLELLKI